MTRSTPAVFLLLFGLSPAASFAATVTPAQRCEADVELASAKYSQCRLRAEAKYSTTLDDDKRTAALARCSEKLQQSFAKAVVRYAGACAATEPSSAFDAYLTQCSNDATAAAAGASLPDYVADLSSCNVSLTTCQSDLFTCAAELTTTASDLTACEGDLAVCEGLPPARLLKTGQTTSYGTGSDGDLQVGVGRHFVDNGDGTITDTKTGLIWEKKSDDNSIHDKDDYYGWSAASYGTTNELDAGIVTFLAILNSGGGFAGRTDWRLPNLTELESIRNLAEAPTTFSAFSTTCQPQCTVFNCSCTSVLGGLGYWTSSTNAGNPKAAWYVDFSYGAARPEDKNAPEHVRAVRGGL